MPTLTRTDRAPRAFHASPTSTSASTAAAEADAAPATTTCYVATTSASRPPPPPSPPLPSRRVPGAATSTIPVINGGDKFLPSSSLLRPASSHPVASVVAYRAPSPPPSAPEVQLTLWLKVLRRRQAQVRRLSRSHLLRSFVDDIVDDLTSSRKYFVDADDGQQQQQQQQQRCMMDLATGFYSSHLLTQSKHQQTMSRGATTLTTNSTATSTEISVEEIGNHFLALFYRSVDDRLPCVMRKHGLDSLRRIFQKLDFRMKQCDAAEEMERTEIEEMRNRSGDDLGGKKRKCMDSYPSMRKKCGEPSSSHGKKKRKADVSYTTMGGNDTLQFDSIHSLDSNNNIMITEKDTTRDPARKELVTDTTQQQQSERKLSEKNRRIIDPSTNDSRYGSSNDSFQFNLTVSKNTITEMIVPQQQNNENASNTEKQGKSMDGTLEESANHCIRGQEKSSNDAVQSSIVTSKDSASHDNVNRNDNLSNCTTEQQLPGAINPPPQHDACTEAMRVSVSKENTNASPDNQLRVTGASIEKEIMLDHSRHTVSSRKRYNTSSKQNQNNQLPSITTIASMSPRIRNETVQQNQQIATDSIESTAEQDALSEKKSSGATRENQPHQKHSDTSSEPSTMIWEPSNLEYDVTDSPPSSRWETVNSDNNRQPQSEATEETELSKLDDKRNGTSGKRADHRIPPSHENMAQAEVSPTQSKSVEDGVADDFSNIPLTTLDGFSGRQNLQLDSNHRVSTSPPETARPEVESNSTDMGGSQTSATSVAAQAESKSNMQAPKAPNLSEVIDLTDDLDDDSPPYNSLKLLDPSPAANPIKQDYDDEDKSNQTAQSDSPPASPVPFPTLCNPPPIPLPDPKPFSDVRPIVFSADDPISSRSLYKRPKTTVMFNAGFQLDGSGSCLDDAHCVAVNERLKTWDPYWKSVQELGRRDVSVTSDADMSHSRIETTKVGTRTAPCIDPVRIRQSATIYIDLPNDIANSDSASRNSTGRSIPIRSMAWGVKWGKSAHPGIHQIDKTAHLQTGDRRLLIRTLPLERSAKDVTARADCHIWPKGTFLEMRRGGIERVLSSNIAQRIQQNHNPSEWKGMSHPLDLTTFVPITDLPFELKLGAYEDLKKSSASDGILMGSYAIQVAICEYVSPDDLYDQLMGNTSESDVIIPTTPLKVATKMAKQYLLGQTVSIIDSDDESNENMVEQRTGCVPGSLTFSLLCSITKTAMQTPVRGRNCGHLQCFDLRNFLHANKSVSGGRWRCAVCEDFVSVRDLVRCGLFQSMIDAVGEEISASRDRVLFHSDGTWRLLESKSRSTTSKKSEADDGIIELA